jgi:hypothetical protein
MNPDQFNALIQAIQEHHNLEVASWIAIIVAAGAAVFTAAAAAYALYFAARQIGTAQSGSRGAFLADLDGRWEGSEMKAARAKWLRMKDEIIRRVDVEYPNLTADLKLKRRAEFCSLHLHELRHGDPEHYNDVISILGFFETVGYIIAKKYVSAEDIADLFGQSIKSFDDLCWDHVQKRIEESRNETGAPTLLWEHACNLILFTREWYSKRANQLGR